MRLKTEFKSERAWNLYMACLRFLARFGVVEMRSWSQETDHGTVKERVLARLTLWGLLPGL